MKHVRTLWFLLVILGVLLVAMPMAAAEGVCAHPNTRVEGDTIQHRIVCVDCGATMWSEEHYANCTAPGLCAYCGTLYMGEEVQHGATRYDVTAVAHWVICTACGETIYEEEHYAWCDAAGVCAVCGTGYTGSHVRHKDAYLSMANDESHHWYACGHCGAITASVEHYPSAANGSVCGACGAVMPAKGTLKQGADGKYYYYGANGTVDTNFSHPAFGFEGGKFIVVEGVVANWINGVQYMSGNDFYFYANGQVQEVTQLAAYDGAWFLLSKGKVNRAYTGLYEYDGELFLITAGQLRSDFTGIWEDSKMGEVEITNGQVTGVG